MEWFKVQELVTMEAYKDRGDKAITTVDNRIVEFLEGLRNALGKPITVNNWHVGGKREWSVGRTPDSPWYSPYSQHSFGRAVDALVSGMGAEDVRQWVIDNRELDWVKPITFIESGESVNWLHVDVRGGTNGDLWVWDKDTGKTKIYKRG